MSMDKCPGHYKVHVHGQDSPGRPVHGHCPIPLPALPLYIYYVIAELQITIRNLTLKSAILQISKIN